MESISPDDTEKVYVATAEDTVLAKLCWFQRGGSVSQRQWSDALGVVRVQGKRLDLDYMREWAERLGVRELPEELLGEVADGWE